MSVLVVGISHNSAPVSVLEKVARDSEGTHKLIRDVSDNEHVIEATVLSTCNRIEVYAEVDRFHGSVEAISRMLLETAGGLPEELVPHLYVHYDDGAVSHLFHVASGLDSMVVGESQILGQAREALRVGQESGTVGPALNTLFQQALRVGKRSHAETDIDRAGPSLVSSALEQAAVHLDRVDGAAGIRALVVGAGAMAGLSVATLTRAGAPSIVIANRTEARAARLAESYGARAIPLADIAAELADVDLLISCTDSTSILVDAETLRSARPVGRPLAIIDLALPRDIDPAVADEPGVHLIDLATLAAELENAGERGEVADVRRIVGQELQAFLAARHAAAVTPTVVALRTMATGVVETELQRLAGRLPDLDDAARAEIELAVRRVADKLLHQPTVRVKELANETGAVSYAAALAELFSLDPDAVEAVTRVEGV
ncbi:glutamyl-tRNA reductase [Nocardioides marmoriginsengisoli]|uniref:Glutamyl-tRNA reductase n=1 Tax=Nocardioides marmoriginsengisoli TaxID=661483 RepID=A0A3N0CFN2_9ACTN|nr:glutamyl-tRNA reductase [Nocardioides marmoriginsengisoli]RNL62272.1 glutamyl-tRNA reductase [Nocardioides marmoriginsengisoli]